jgi:hypothetical protein
VSDLSRERGKRKEKKKEKKKKTTTTTTTLTAGGTSGIKNDKNTQENTIIFCM